MARCAFQLSDPNRFNQTAFGLQSSNVDKKIVTCISTQHSQKIHLIILMWAKSGILSSQCFTNHNPKTKKNAMLIILTRYC
jgi:hypothetical protein